MTNPADYRTSPPAPPLAQRHRTFPRLQELGLIIVILLIGTFLTSVAPTIGRTGENAFLRPANLIPSVFTTMSWIAVMAIGVTVVIISGGIDISVGSIMGLAALGTAAVLQNLPEDASPWRVIPLGVGVPLGIGLLCGLINGSIVVGLRMHPFIVTLGTLSIFRGIAVVSVAEGSLPYGDRILPEAFTDDFIAYTLTIGGTPNLPWLIAWLPWLLLGLWVVWQGYQWIANRRLAVAELVVVAIVFAVRWYLRRYLFTEGTRPEFLQPVPMIVMLIATVLGWLYLRWMVWGRETYAVGGNEEATRFSGIRVPWVKLRAYLISGLCAGIAGMLSCGYYKSAATNTGLGYELMVIAAAVVGGASLSGGRGTALGAILGTLIIQLIDNGISILSEINLGFARIPVSKEYTQIIIGIAIIVAVAVDRFSEYVHQRRLARLGAQR